MEPTEREKRILTEEATNIAMQKEAPPKKAGEKKRGGKTAKIDAAEKLLHQLYDIAQPDENQPKRLLQLLNDQRTERKEVFAPVLGMLKVEKNRKKKEEMQNKQKDKENAEELVRFETVCK